MNKKLFISLFLLFKILSSYSQFSNSSAINSFIDSTEYVFDSIQDPIFIYNGEIGDSLTAQILFTPSISADTLNFDWFKYNAVKDSFDFLYTDSNMSNSEYTTTQACGLKVRIYDGGVYDTSFYCWIFFNRLSVAIYKYDDNCSVLNIKTDVKHEPNDFTYYEPGKASPIKLKYDYGIQWEITPIDPLGEFESEIGLTAPDKTNFFDYNPPPVDVNYTATVSDSFKNSVSTEFNYETIHTFARYKIEIWDSWKLADTVLHKLNDRGDNLHSAPAEVHFSNKSKNGGSFEWIFIDQSSVSSLSDYYKDIAPIYKVVEDTLSQKFMYYYSGYYKAIMISTAKNSPCTDTFPSFDADLQDLDIEIDIADSEFKGNGKVASSTDASSSSTSNSTTGGGAAPDIPNTIQRSGIYNTFRIRNISLCDVYIKIYDRWGRNVYNEEFHGNIDDEWEGWNGKDKNGSDLKAGVYFYEMEASGCETTPIHYKDKNGKVNGKKRIMSYSGIINIFD